MNSVFFKISVSAKEIKQNAFVIGQNVFSFVFKRRINKNIDIFIKNSGKLLALMVSKKKYDHPIIICFKRFKIVRFKAKKNGNQLEFISDVNCIKVFGTMAISLDVNNFGLLIDNLNTHKAYYKNVLCIIRSIRFASELRLINQISFYYIFGQIYRIRAISIINNGIINEFNKIILSQTPSIGVSLLYEIGLLTFILPEIKPLKEFKKEKGSNHKNNLLHTIEVLKNISKESKNLWLRWAALLHDIGKSISKKYINGIGWTFYVHENIGSRMIPYIFYRLKLPMNCIMKIVQKIIYYSSRPIDLVSYESTDSAVRRLLFSFGNKIQDLLLLSKADITTKYFEKKLRYINNILLVEDKLKNIYLKDTFRSWLTFISGNKIMHFFQLQPSLQIGLIKKALKEAILAGKLINNFYLVYSFMKKKGKKLGFSVQLIGNNFLV